MGLQNYAGSRRDWKDCTKILVNPQIANKCPQLLQNRSHIAISQGSEHNPPETRAMRAQSFAIMLIVVGLQVQCNPIAILLPPATIQFSVPWHRPTGAKSQHKLSDPVTIMNPHAIKLKCDGIAKVQRIAIWLIGLHKNCTDCRQIAATVRLDEGSTAIPTGFGQMTRSGLFPAVQSAIHQKPRQS